MPAGRLVALIGVDDLVVVDNRSGVSLPELRGADELVQASRAQEELFGPIAAGAYRFWVSTAGYVSGGYGRQRPDGARLLYATDTAALPPPPPLPPVSTNLGQRFGASAGRSFAVVFDDANLTIRHDANIAAVQGGDLGGKHIEIVREGDLDVRAARECLGKRRIGSRISRIEDGDLRLARFAEAARPRSSRP